MKVQRNAPCPCGSGKKYKQCCLNKVQTTPITQKLLLVFVILFLGAGALAAFLSLRGDGNTGDGQGRVWSEEHQHWH